MKTMTCSSCGREMWQGRTSLPEGEAMCHPCRRKTTRYLERERVLAEREARRQAPEIHICVVCSTEYLTRIPHQRYCTKACRTVARQGRGVTVVRGYGRAHQKLREAWRLVVEAGEATCCLCDEPLEPDADWHLDHNPGGDGYRGAAHASCNVADGGRRGGTATARLHFLKRAGA